MVGRNCLRPQVLSLVASGQRGFTKGKSVMAWPRLVAVAALAFSLALPAFASDTLVLNTGTLAPYTTEQRTGFLDQMVAELFARIGHRAEVLVYGASARALQHADNGVDDGAAMRIAGLESKYPNLVRIPEPLIVNDFVAISSRPSGGPVDWSALKSHSVAYIRGWQVFERNLEGSTNLSTVKGAEELFGLLAKGRADIVLYERWQGLWRARDVGLDVQVLEPPLAQQTMYIYVNAKHQALVPALGEALAQMKADGAYQAIVDRTLTPLLHRGGR